jgi:DNA-directed RNA polymerase I, II, and III subunit RPABC2
MSDSENDNGNQQTDIEDYSDNEESIINGNDTSDEDKEDSLTIKPKIKIGSFVEADVDDISIIDSDDDDDEDISGDEIDQDKSKDNIVSRSAIKNTKTPEKNVVNLIQQYSDDEDEDTDADEEDDTFLQKLDKDVVSSYIEDMHPESKIHNYDEVKALANVVRNKEGTIIDELHRTIPILTKFEKTRILGIRAKQIDEGGQPLIMVPDNMIDGYTIALDELVQKAIPFIIKRPIPNGGSEYWRVSDLEII